MGTLQVGCRGFPVGRERYFRELSAVEVSDTRSRLPRLETARRWRESATSHFNRRLFFGTLLVCLCSDARATREPRLDART